MRASRIGYAFHRRAGIGVTAIAVAAALVALFAPAPALASFTIKAFDGQVAADASGTPFTQAGGHPFSASTTVVISSHNDPTTIVNPVPDASFKDVEVQLPAGFIGNPTAVPTCTAAELGSDECPGGAQVGVAYIAAFGLPRSFAPIYNLVPPAGTPADFGFSIQGFVTNLYPRVRTGGDYGISIDVKEISQGLPIEVTGVSLWGVPAAEVHDAERCGSIQGETSEGGPLCIGEPGTITGPSSAGIAAKPFLRNPTSCTPAGVGLLTTLRTDSWQEPGAFESASFVSHLLPGYPLPPAEWGAPQGPTNCASLPFAPTISAHPTTNEADSPTGLSVDVHLPQEGLENPTGIAGSDLKEAVVTLPEGMTVNPSSASGLGTCSEAQIDLGGPDPASCPESSRLGSVKIDTPLLDHPIEGGVYLARQGENKFGSLLALYIAADDARTGVVVKLAGRVAPDPQTGRLTASFDDNPQLPFEDLEVEFFGGPQASLITPPACGTYSTTGSFTPWSGAAAVSARSSFAITRGPEGRPCPNGSFEPGFQAGSVNPLAGSYSPLVMRITRADGSPRLRAVSATLPEGLTGKLKGIPYCPDATLAGISEAEGTAGAQVAAPACPRASELGGVTVGAGAGVLPFYLDTGRAYLAGPYKGAPLSMAIVTPALAGPFDLGSVVVRTALHVDPATSQITAVSDPLPTILHGIPLDLRDIRIDVDRSQFTINPTSCDQMEVKGTIGSAGGQSANVSDRFQVASCEALRFKPRLALRLSGAPTRRGGYPKLRAVLKMPQHGANIQRAQVLLPKTEFLENAHIRTICTRVQYAAGQGGGAQCPKASIYGYARAWSPLLDRPLQGPVYLRSSNHKLPDLVAALDGQIHIDLVGRIDAKKARIRNTFETVPDAPVSRFVLTMQGGKKGLLVNNTNICRTKPRANVRFDGQNGKLADSKPLVKVAKCAKKRK